MASITPGAKKDGTSVPPKTPPARQVPPFAPGGVKVAAPRTGNGRKHL